MEHTPRRIKKIPPAVSDREPADHLTRIDWAWVSRMLEGAVVGEWKQIASHRKTTRAARSTYLRTHPELQVHRDNGFEITGKAVKMMPRSDGKPSRYRIYVQKNHQKKEEQK